MAKSRIADHFWAEDNKALNILSERMQNSNSTCNAIRTVFEKRARIEEEYGQRLLQLSEISLSEFEESYSTFSESLESIPTATEAAARAHIDLAQHIKQLLETPLAGFIRNQKEQWKMATTRVGESQNLKSRYIQGMQHAQSKYMDECTKLSRANSLMDYNARSEIQQSLHIISSLEQSYKQSLEDLESVSKQWVDDWRNTCETFQKLEENRIDYLRRTIWSYANMMSTVYVVDDQSCERIRTSLEVIDISGDTNAFVNKKGTSTTIPNIPQFVPFNNDHNDPLFNLNLNHLNHSRNNSQSVNSEGKGSNSRNTHEINIPVADEELRSVNDQLRMLPLTSEIADTKFVHQMSDRESSIIIPSTNSRLSFKDTSNILGREISQTRTADSSSDMLQNTLIPVLPALDKSPTDGLFRESWDRPAFSRKESNGRIVGQNTNQNQNHNHNQNRNHNNSNVNKYDTKQVHDLEHIPRSPRHAVSIVDLPQRTSSLPKDANMIFSSYATQLAPAESVDNLPDWHAYNDYLSNTPVSTLAQNQLERKSRSGDFSKLVVNTSLDSINANNSTTNNPNYTISSSNNNNNNNNNSLYASSTYRQRSALLTPNQTADHGDHSDQNQNQNQSRDRDRDRDPELWKHSRSPSLQSPGQHIYRYNNSSNNNNNNNNINNHATLESPTDYGYQQPSPLMTPSVSPRRDKEKDKDKDKDRGKNPNRLSVFTFFKKSHHSSSNKKSEKSLSSPDYHNQHNTSNSIHRSPIRDNSCDSQKSKSRRFSMVFSNSQKKKQALSISSTIQPMSPQTTTTIGTEAVTITPTAAAGGRCLDNLSGVVLDPRNPSSLMQLSNPIDDEGTTGEEYAQALWNFEAKIDTEISFAKNDILAILYKKPDGWWVAEVLPKQNNPQQQGPGPRIRGLVPGNYFRPL